MFDSVLRRETLPKRRFGSGAVIALLVFAGAAAFTAWAQARALVADRKEVAVTFVKPPPPPPPPPPPAPTQPKPKPKKAEPPKTVQLAQAIVAPTIVPQEKPPEQEPPPQPAGQAGGEIGGEVGGVAGGIRGGVVVEANPKAPVEFDPGKMEDPKFIGGPSPQYTEKALEREVQGTMVVRCLVTTDGRVSNCRVLRSLPFMDRAVIDALEKRRYAPATEGGRPVNTYYQFKINLKMPE
jgi:protein TonB